MLQNNDHSVQLNFMSFQACAGGCAQTQKPDKPIPGSDVTAELFPLRLPHIHGILALFTVLHTSVCSNIHSKRVWLYIFLIVANVYRVGTS